MTLLVGENNTGKTFFATVLHRLLNSAPTAPWSQRIRPDDTPVQVRDWITEVLDDPGGDVSASSTCAFVPNDSTSRWARKLTKDILEAYGDSVRYDITYAFGAEASRLRRRTASRHASGCYLRICNSHPNWEVEIRFDSKLVTVTPPDPQSWLIHALDPDEIRKTPQTYSRLRRASSLRVSEHLGYSPVALNSLVNSALFGSWPRNAIHLPADRTGIIQSHNVLAGATARQAARAGIRPIEIETLPGTSADFLSLVLEIPEGMSYATGRTSRFSQIVGEFEQDMRAAIEIDQRADGMDAIVAVTSEGRFPMARASSMLSELAPLILVLKSPHILVDHLTIDEPEAHLHPAMQIRVASFLATLANQDVSVVLTTHSDFFVSQFNNMMRLNELSGSGKSKSYNFPRLDRSRVRALRFSRENGWCVARTLEPDRVDGIDESTFTRVMRSQFSETARLVNELLETHEE